MTKYMITLVSIVSATLSAYDLTVAGLNSLLCLHYIYNSSLQKWPDGVKYQINVE